MLEKKRKDKERKQREMRKYLEMEAELGSDNEENDDGAAKHINREGDEEEDEEGQDEDLKDFVVYEGDDQEIGDENVNMYEKYARDIDLQDRLNLQKTMEAVIFGRNNKKRKRDEVEGLDDMDDPQRRRKKLMEERFKLLRDNEDMAPEDLLLAAAEA